MPDKNDIAGPIEAKILRTPIGYRYEFACNGILARHLDAANKRIDGLVDAMADGAMEADRQLDALSKRIRKFETNQ